MTYIYIYIYMCAARPLPPKTNYRQVEKAPRAVPLNTTYTQFAIQDSCLFGPNP